LENKKYNSKKAKSARTRAKSIKTRTEITTARKQSQSVKSNRVSKESLKAAGKVLKKVPGKKFNTDDLVKAAARTFWNTGEGELSDLEVYEQKGSKVSDGIRRLSQGELRKHLDERLVTLHRRAMIIESELRKLEDNRFYRTCIFGSARIKDNSSAYKDAFNLARQLAWRGIDILTGGGPGLMEAANMGATLGRREKNTRALSFGLSIQLEWEPEPNHHLDIKRHHMKFSSRLDDFMRLSNSIIVTPGGIGTLLELFFTWQLIQVQHIEHRPIVLLNRGFWTGLLDWIKEHPLAQNLISAKDMHPIALVDTIEEAVEIISKHHQEFLTKRKKSRKNR